MVYCRDCWWSDNWEPLDYGRDYDFSRPFFEQFLSLFQKVPRSALTYTNTIDSKYLNFAIDIKNGYLVFISHNLENVSYANVATYVKDSLDILTTDRSEFCYETINSAKCFRVFTSIYAEECRSSGLLYNCRNCSESMACVNLRNKSYCIFNEQFSKEEYQNKIRDLDLGSFKNFEGLKNKFKSFALKYPRRSAMIRNSVNTIGDDIRYAKNCYRCFYITNGAEDCRYSAFLSDPVKDSVDVVFAAFSGTELLYDIQAVAGQRVSFSYAIYYSNDVSLSESCHYSQSLFACIGLRNKSYCILNKQYTKEEYEKLVPKIIEHMNQMPYIDKKGRVYKYGEFFPPELSPFSY
ncbi:hypothetical protein HY406_00725, partial [Candidatus Giovannonibacteria bacterium]|nr:hypothetical protein [Candidatus Giovannonibacteria bacterium]